MAFSDDTMPPIPWGGILVLGVLAVGLMAIGPGQGAQAARMRRNGARPSSAKKKARKKAPRQLSDAAWVKLEDEGVEKEANRLGLAKQQAILDEIEGQTGTWDAQGNDTRSQEHRESDWRRFKEAEDEIERIYKRAVKTVQADIAAERAAADAVKAARKTLRKYKR